MLINVFNVVCAARLAICRIALVSILAMQSCVMCSFVRCGTSNQMEKIYIYPTGLIGLLNYIFLSAYLCLLSEDHISVKQRMNAVRGEM